MTRLLRLLFGPRVPTMPRTWLRAIAASASQEDGSDVARRIRRIEDERSEAVRLYGGDHALQHRIIHGVSPETVAVPRWTQATQAHGYVHRDSGVGKRAGALPRSEVRH